MSGGTAFTFLHRQVGAATGVFGERLRLKDGPGALINALADRAKAAGVTIQTGAAVKNVIVGDDRIAGVLLESGEEISCREVVSSLDPYRTLLELLDPVHLDPDFIQAVRNIRFRGVTTKVLVALDQLPTVPGVTATALNGAVVIAPSIRYLEKAYDATKYGRCSEEPAVEVRFPSVGQSGLAPAGKHVAVMSVQFTPYRLREGGFDALRDQIADRATTIVDRHLPGFASRVTARAVLTPVDLETQFGLREGAVSQGEMMLDQILFMRPVAGAARHAMPVPGLFLCGAGSHPGGGITGMSGWLAARAVLAGRTKKG
jgi:phytoene dehydrogenase-like protein